MWQSEHTAICRQDPSWISPACNFPICGVFSINKAQAEPQEPCDKSCRAFAIALPVSFSRHVQYALPSYLPCTSAQGMTWYVLPPVSAVSKSLWIQSSFLEIFQMHVLLHAARGPCCHWLPSCSQARAHGWALPLPLGISLGRAWDADRASCLKKSSADSETPWAKQCPSCHSILVLQRHPSGWGMQSQVKWAPQLWKAFHLGFSFPRAKWSATVGTPARSMKSWLVTATMSAWTEFLTGEKILGTEVWLYFTRMPAKKNPKPLT